VCGDDIENTVAVMGGEGQWIDALKQKTCWLLRQQLILLDPH
jgi:trans-2-enoyl-CoA reductase